MLNQRDQNWAMDVRFQEHSTQTKPISSRESTASLQQTYEYLEVDIIFAAVDQDPYRPAWYLEMRILVVVGLVVTTYQFQP